MPSEVTDEVGAAIEEAVQFLAKQGAIFRRDVEIPILDDTSKVLMGIILPEASAAHDELLAARREIPSVDSRQIGNWQPDCCR